MTPWLLNELKVKLSEYISSDKKIISGRISKEFLTLNYYLLLDKDSNAAAENAKSDKIWVNGSKASTPG